MAEKVIISWEMDHKQAIKAVKAVRGEMEGVPKSAGKADKGVTGLSKSFHRLATIVSGAALIGGIRSVIRTFAGFETAAVNVQNITGLTTRQMGDLAREIKELPPALGTATDLMRGLYQAISAGVPRENAVAFLAENAKAAKGNLADLTITVDASTSVLAAYGLEASHTTSVLDAMTKTVDLGKLTFADLAGNIGKGIGIAATAGVTYQELMATMAALTLSGLSVEEAMTGIRNILVTTIKAKPGEMMEKFGVEMSTAAIKAQGFAGYMGSVAEAVRGNEQATAALFPNIRAMNAAMSLASEEGGRRWNEILGEIVESEGKVETNFERMAGTFNAKSAEMAAQLELLKIKMAEDVMPAIIQAMGPAIDLLAKFVDLISFKGMNALDENVNSMWTFGDSVNVLAVALKEAHGSIAAGIKEVTGANEMSVQGLAIYIRMLANRGVASKEMLKLLEKMDDAEAGHVETLEEAAPAIKDVVTETKKMPPAIEEVIAAVVDWGDVLDTLTDYVHDAWSEWEKFWGAYQTGVEESTYALWDWENNVMDVTGSTVAAFYAVADATDDSTDMMASSFSDLLGKGFIGELETFADLWDAIWQDLAKSMMGILGEAFEDAFKPGGGGIAGLWENFQETIESNRLGAGLGGAGMMYAGYQQGGTGGVMQGMMGGAMTGAAIGSIVPGIGTAIGAVVGAIVGGVASYFGGQDSPESSGRISMTGGQITGLSGHGGLSPSERRLWVQEQVEQYRASIMMMNDVLRLFGDGDLFDLLGEAGTWEFDGSSLDSMAQVFREQWLPRAMTQIFRRAINTGLRGLGVDRDTLQQLWSEVGELTGTAQITALETFIGSLVGLTDLYGQMDWNAIVDESRQNSMQAFIGGMGEALDAVQTQMLGLDQMTLLERAGQAQTIEQLMLGARGAEIQMLMQIDALQEGINRGVAQQIEGLRTGGMSDTQLQTYYGSMIDSLMAQMRGGLESPEAIQSIMADLQRYIGLYQGALGDQLYGPTSFGGTYADELIAILEEARGLSTDALEAMRDQIRETNDALIAELQRLITALTHYGDTIATADAAPPPELIGDIDINVNVFAGEYFDARVEGLIQDWAWRQQSDAGPN